MPCPHDPAHEETDNYARPRWPELLDEETLEQAICQYAHYTGPNVPEELHRFDRARRIHARRARKAAAPRPFPV